MGRVVFFCKQRTAHELRISDWSSDVCSSDLSDDTTMINSQVSPWLLLIPQLPAKPAYLRVKVWRRLQAIGAAPLKNAVHALPNREIGRASCRERVCQYV